MPEHQRYLMTAAYPDTSGIPAFTGEVVATSLAEARQKADELVPEVARQYDYHPDQMRIEVRPTQVLGLDWELVHEFYEALPHERNIPVYLTVEGPMVRVTKVDWASYELEVVQEGVPARYVVGTRGGGFFRRGIDGLPEAADGLYAALAMFLREMGD